MVATSPWKSAEKYLLHVTVAGNIASIARDDVITKKAKAALRS